MDAILLLSLVENSDALSSLCAPAMNVTHAAWPGALMCRELAPVLSARWRGLSLVSTSCHLALKL